MNKKLTAIAVATAMAPFAAQAAPTVYGIGQVEFAQIDNSYAQTSTTSSAFADRNHVVDNKMGRFGFKGSEDLGGGLSAIYVMEFGIEGTDSAGSTNDIFDRETMIGLKIGKAHQVQFGNLKSPYKYSGGVKYDSFVATTLQARQGSSVVTGTFGQVGGVMSSGATGHGGFIDNSIAYKGNFGPVSVWAAYSPDESTGDSGKFTSLGVTAKISSFQFGAATMNQASCQDAVAGGLCNTTGGTTNRNELDALKVFGSWSKAGHTIRAQLENVESTSPVSGSTTSETDYMYLNYQFKMGKHMIDVAVGEADNTAGTVTTAADVDWSRLAYQYNFSKTTRVFAGIATRDDKGTTTTTSDNDTDVISVGMTVKF
jgi:predicted porin